MSIDQKTQQNPVDQYRKPTYPDQKQPMPGSEAQMTVKPDYGLESYQGSGRLKDRAAIVTGADSGIGRAVALAFAREGADVLIAYLNEEEDAQETLRAVQAAGRKGILMPGDVGDADYCVKVVERAISEFGHLDIVVNNAAFQATHEGIDDLPAEEWEYTFRTNISAMFYMCKAALPRMREGGAIVNSASIQAFQPTAALLAYATTKGAIVTFTKALAQDAIKRGIRVNAVAPGPVWTPLIVSTMPEEQVKHFGESSPIGRAAQPAELAHSYVFLASQEASYITGEVIGVTGGKPLS